MIVIDLHQSMKADPGKVQGLLLDHVNLSRFFGAKFLLKQAQDQGEIAGGKGAIRQVKIGPVQFLEQIIKADGQHICYEIIAPGPVTQHQGNIYLTPDGEHSQVNYVIRFKGPTWLPDFIIKTAIARDIKRALAKIARFCHEC